MIKVVFLTIFTFFLFLLSGCNGNGKGDCNLVVEVSDMPTDCNLTYEEFVALGKVCDKPNNPPKIVSYESNSTNEVSINENSTNITKLLASDLDGDSLTYSLSGVDSNLFTIVNGEISFKTAPNYEKPLDSNGDNIYEVVVSVSDSNGGSDSASFNIKVNNVQESVSTPTIVPTPVIIATPIPTITPSPTVTPTPTPETTNNAPTITNYSEVTNLTIDENIANVASIKASDIDGDNLVYSLFGSDMDKFNISQDGNLSFVIAPNFEIPLDSNGDNVYEVIVRVSDGSLYSEVLFMITINDVVENAIISMEIDKEYTVQTGDKVEVLSDDAVINVVHTLDDNTKVITLISGSANLIRGDYAIKE